MSSCVYPGSFDPVTTGHMDLIRRASAVFEHVTVVVMVNIHKYGTIPVEKRLEILRKACSDIENVSVEIWHGLLADYMSLTDTNLVLRGVRDSEDFNSEMRSASVNRLLGNGIETVLMPSSSEYSSVSSSAVKEIFSFGGDIRKFLPEKAADEIIDCLKKKD